MIDKLKFPENVGFGYDWLIRHSNNMFYIHTTDHKLVYVSPQVERILGYTQEEALVNWTNFLTDNPINETGINYTLEAIRTGKRQPIYEFELKTKTGKNIWVEVNETPVLEDGVVKYITGSLYEITERKKSEVIQRILYKISNAINQTDDLEELFKHIRQLLSEILNVKNFYIALYNERSQKILFPYFTSEYETKPEPVEASSSKGITQYMIDNGEAVLVNSDELREMHDQGLIELSGKLPRQWLGAPLKINNSVIGIVSMQSFNEECYSQEDMGLLNFVSEELALAIKHKQAEQKILNSLMEKESLLRELYHRTRNNMQVVEAMLMMSAEFSQNQEMIEFNQEVADKIYSMSLVHQKLYEEDDLSQINLLDYINDFSTHLLKKYNNADNRYQIHLDLASVKISIDSAIPLGLVLTELLLHSFKNASPDLKNGIIEIKLYPVENKQMVLEIIDKIISVKPGTLINDTIGIKTAFSIVELQLLGEMTYEINNELKWKITFSDAYSQKRVSNPERKQQILSINESEDKFRIISETSPMAIMIYQKDSWVYANKAASLISGYSNEELMHMHYWDFIHPKYQKKIRAVGHKRQLKQSVLPSYEFKIITKSGEEKWVWSNGSATVFNGKPAGIITVLDITARKKAEKELKESEERFKFLTQATFEGIIVHKKGTVIDANDSFVKMSGYSREELIGANLLNYIHRVKDRAKVIFNIAKKNAKPYTVLARRKDGSEFIAELEAKDVIQGNELVRIAAVRDVTERQKAQEQLKIAHERLRTMNSILRHDIANDLSVIESALELYLENPQRNLLMEMQRVVGRGIQAIRKQQKQSHNLDNLDFREKICLNRVIDEISGNHPEIKIILSADHKIMVQADESIYSVFDNLISNAITHGNSDLIRIDIESQKEFYSIRFADNGKGIPLKIIPEIFNEGFHYGKTGHTGIGLYIVKKTILELGGSISVDTDTTRGTAFIIKLLKA